MPYPVSMIMSRSFFLIRNNLVNQSGMTLYSLSAEKNGRFICTNSACLKLWHPVVAPSGGLQGDSVSSLGTIKRPGAGAMQVTYRGLPLYTFAVPIIDSGYTGPPR